MPAKKVFEDSMTEPIQESGMALRNHIISLLDPFKDIAQLEWAVAQICSVCDDVLEPYRPSLHSKECLSGAVGGCWKCICN